MSHRSLDWMEEELVCPRDEALLRAADGALLCRHGHRYPCIEGIPVMTLEELPPTQPQHWASAEQIEKARKTAPEPLGPDRIDPIVAGSIVNTHGYLYRSLVDRLPRYPIPYFPSIPGARSGRLLDLGCHWGRWCLSAQRAGYTPIGIDPNFEAVLAARRVAAQLGAPIHYVCGDARRLPFRSASFEVVHSYSVLQHLARPHVEAAIDEIARVLAPGGASWVQMANALGVRSLYRQLRRGFRRPRAFDVRYWRPAALSEAFSRIGATEVLVDGFFTLDPQLSDLDLLPRRYRAVVRASEALRRLSLIVPPLTNIADSLILLSHRPAA